MSNPTEAVMVELFAALELSAGFNTYVRGPLTTVTSADLPLLRLSQGLEDVEVTTMTSSGGTCEITLNFSVDIFAQAGTQNIETTMNHLRRNVLLAISSLDSFFIVYEERAGGPDIEIEDGEVSASMALSFRAEYTRPWNDPT